MHSEIHISNSCQMYMVATIQRTYHKKLLLHTRAPQLGSKRPYPFLFSAIQEISRAQSNAQDHELGFITSSLQSSSDSGEKVCILPLVPLLMRGWWHHPICFRDCTHVCIAPSWYSVSSRSLLAVRGNTADLRYTLSQLVNSRGHELGFISSSSQSSSNLLKKSVSTFLSLCS